VAFALPTVLSSFSWRPFLLPDAQRADSDDARVAVAFSAVVYFLVSARRTPR
jgi:hypothetical protein